MLTVIPTGSWSCQWPLETNWNNRGVFLQEDVVSLPPKCGLPSQVSWTSECWRQSFTATGIPSYALLLKMASSLLGTDDPVQIGPRSDYHILGRIELPTPKSSDRTSAPCSERFRMSSLQGFASSCACSPLLPVQAVTSESRRHKSQFFVCLSHTRPSCDPDLKVARYSCLHHSGVTAVLDGRVRACCLSSNLDGLKLCDTSGLREVQSVEVLHRVVRLVFGRHLRSSSESPAFFVVDASRSRRLVVRTGVVVVRLPSAPCGRMRLACPQRRLVAVLAVVMKSAQHAFEGAATRSRGVR